MGVSSGKPLYCIVYFALLLGEVLNRQVFNVNLTLRQCLDGKWPDKSTTSYDMLDFKSYILKFDT